MSWNSKELFELFSVSFLNITLFNIKFTYRNMVMVMMRTVWFMWLVFFSLFSAPMFGLMMLWRMMFMIIQIDLMRRTSADMNMMW